MPPPDARSRRRISDARAYERITGIFKKHRDGMTLADVAAASGISLAQVRELVPFIADEYSARLEVSESGEILYSFPRSFSSRYRGIFPALKRLASSFSRFAIDAVKLLFKAWIMVMLLGYFLLFAILALCSLFFSFSAGHSSNNRRNGRGGWHFSAGILDLILRFWLYSEISGGGRAGRVSGRKTSGRPLYKAIFSFVFGEDDPNRDRAMLEKKAFVSWLRSRRGVVFLPELMIITGLSPEKAGELITGLCVEFGGSPEATEEGTVLYRFEEILVSGKTKEDDSPANGLPPPLYWKQDVFSRNPEKMNFWFSLINGVNLLFGSYFFSNAVKMSGILDELALNSGATLSGEFILRVNEILRSAGIYGKVHYFLANLGIAPIPVIQIALGIIPLLFSVFFWLIPFVRSRLLKKKNETLRLRNFLSLGYSGILGNPDSFSPARFNPGEEQCRPHNIGAAKDLLVKQMGSYSLPEVSLDEKRNEVFSFPGLRRELDALEKYRLSMDSVSTAPGKIIFDSES